MSNLAYKIQEEEQQQQQIHKKPRVKAIALTKAEKALIGFFVCSTFLLLIQYLSIMGESYSINMQIQKDQAEIEGMQKTNYELQSQIEKLSSPNRILHIAEKKGMVLETGNVKTTD